MVKRSRGRPAAFSAALGLAALLCLPGGARAELDALFYPPELVLRFGKQAGLEDEVIDRVRKDVFATQSQMIDLEAKLRHLQLEIEQAVSDDALPVEEILKKVEAVGAAETEMKKLQVGLLVRTRRALAPEERRKLDGFKEKMGPPSPPPPPGMGPRPPEPPRPGGPGGPPPGPAPQPPR
jgi:hypothetical protein